MPRAVLIGGTGMIGRAAARALVGDGWEVVAVSRSGTLPDVLAELGVESVAADREDDAQLRVALGTGADVVLDTVAMGREHGEQLNGLAGLVGSLVVISTGSVYADDEGRALDGEGGDPPAMPVPILEMQRTAEPGDATYSTRKAELEADAAARPDSRDARPGLRDPRPRRAASARALLRASARSTAGAGSRSRGTARAGSTRRRWRTSRS